MMSRTFRAKMDYFRNLINFCPWQIMPKSYEEVPKDPLGPIQKPYLDAVTCDLNTSGDFFPFID